MLNTFLERIAHDSPCSGQLGNKFSTVLNPTVGSLSCGALLFLCSRQYLHYLLEIFHQLPNSFLFQKIPMKDFAAEIRASMDVENFLNSAILLLNLDEASIDAILDRMLRPLIVDNDEPVSLAEAKRAIFTHDSGKKSLRIFL